MPDLDGQDIVSLAAGSLNSAAIARDGSCFTWGSGKVTALGASCFVSWQGAWRAAALMRQCLPKSSTCWQLPKILPNAALHAALCKVPAVVNRAASLVMGAAPTSTRPPGVLQLGLIIKRSHFRPVSTKRILLHGKSERPATATCI